MRFYCLFSLNKVAFYSKFLFFMNNYLLFKLNTYPSKMLLLNGHLQSIAFCACIFQNKKIEKGTNGRLWGTHIYGVNIDRLKETRLAKTITGMTEFLDFEYCYVISRCIKTNPKRL